MSEPEGHEAVVTNESEPTAKLVFEPGGTNLTPESEQVVSDLAPRLQASKRAACFFILDDGTGSSSFSAQLGARRAQALEKRFAAAGVGAGKIRFQTRYVERPSDPPAGWSGSGVVLVEPCP